MDPWLEHRGLWAGVHDSLIVDMAREITRQLAPRYVARPGRRMVVETPERYPGPDVTIIEGRPATPRRPGAELQADPPVTLVLDAFEVKETFIEVKALYGRRRIVTVVEILSLSNKRAGTDSREKYLEKQAEVLSSDVHLVEIDLLRAGEPTVAVPQDYLASLPPHDYRVVVRRAGLRNRADVYPTPLRRRLPRIPIPLSPPDADMVLDLQRLLVRVFEDGAYAVEIDYRRPPDPPLSKADSIWAHRMARAPK